MKRLFTTLLVVLFVSATSFAQTIINFTPSLSNFGDYGIGQSFQSTTTGVITRIDVKSLENYSNLKLHLYHSNNGSGVNGVGTPEYSEINLSLVANDPLNANDWNSVILSMPFSVLEGEMYSFLFEGETTFFPITLYHSSSNDYSDGSLIYQYGSPFPPIDLNFRIWEESTPAAPPVPAPLKLWPFLLLVLCVPAFVRIIKSLV